MKGYWSFKAFQSCYKQTTPQSLIIRHQCLYTPLSPDNIQPNQINFLLRKTPKKKQKHTKL